MDLGSIEFFQYQFFKLNAKKKKKKFISWPLPSTTSFTSLLISCFSVYSINKLLIY